MPGRAVVPARPRRDFSWLAGSPGLAATSFAGCPGHRRRARLHGPCRACAAAPARGRLLGQRWAPPLSPPASRLLLPLRRPDGARGPRAGHLHPAGAASASPPSRTGGGQPDSGPAGVLRWQPGLAIAGMSPPRRARPLGRWGHPQAARGRAGGCLRPGGAGLGGTRTGTGTGWLAARERAPRDSPSRSSLISWQTRFGRRAGKAPAREREGAQPAAVPWCCLRRTLLTGTRARWRRDESPAPLARPSRG